MILWKRFLKFFTLDGTWNKWSHVFGSWFLLTILIYLLLHSRCHEHGKQVKFLNVNEIAVINSIYTQNGKDQPVNVNPPNNSTTAGEDSPVGQPRAPQTALPSGDKKIIDSKSLILDYLSSLLTYYESDTCEQDGAQKREAARKATRKELDSIFKSYSAEQLVVVLPTYPFFAKSYFWLSGDWLYLEIIFWTLFGIFCSLFYGVSEAIRTNNYNRMEEASQFAKLFYGPPVTLVIYLFINELTKNGDIAPTTNTFGALVLAFILGFFSGRAIDLLTKIKDVLLPKAEGGQSGSIKYSIEGVVIFDSATIDPPIDKLDGTKIILQTKDKQQVAETQCNKEGKFSFKEIAPNEYSVDAKLMTDYHLFEGSTEVKVDSSQPSQNITLSLKDTTTE